MSASITSAPPLSAAEIARRRAPKPAIPAPAVDAPASTPASAQAQAGAQGVQPGAEPYNAPQLVLADAPTSRDVRLALIGAMAHPGVNQTTVQRLMQLHDQLMSAERAMIQTILDGVVS